MYVFVYLYIGFLYVLEVWGDDATTFRLRTALWSSTGASLSLRRYWGCLETSMVVIVADGKEGEKSEGFIYWAEARHSTCCCSLSCCSCSTLCNPMDCSTPGFPVLHHLPEFAQTHVHWVGDAIQPSHPLSSPSPPAFNLSQHQSLF